MKLPRVAEVGTAFLLMLTLAIVAWFGTRCDRSPVAEFEQVPE